MDLYSANQADSWSPVVSLLTLSPDTQPNTPALLPVWEAPQTQFYSTVFHELTHLWSFRTTRLGWFTSYFASALFAQWYEDPKQPIELPTQFQIVLAAYTPLLEGLAMYSQLDYEPVEMANPLPSPLLLTAEMFKLNRAFYNRSTGQIFRLVRSQVCPTYQSVGIMELLLLVDEPKTRAYFSGYLYVKAVQAYLAHRCQKFGRSDVFLPVAIRLLFDHPIVLKALHTPLTPADIVNAVHDTIVNLSPQSLQAIGQALEENPELIERFDHWDIYAALGAPDFHMAHFHGEESLAPLIAASKQFASSVTQAPFLSKWGEYSRASGSILITGWEHGTLVAYRNTVLTLRVNGEEIDLLMGYLSGLFQPDGTRTVGPAPQEMQQAADAMGIFEATFTDRLASRKGSELTVGTFITATRGTSGAALWSQGKLDAWYPHGPQPFLDNSETTFVPDSEELQTISLGLALSPQDRQELAKKLRQGDTQRRFWMNLAAEELMHKLVSKGVVLGLLRNRLSDGFWPHAVALRKQFAFSIAPRSWSDLPAEVVAAATAVFDLPGFPKAAGEAPVTFLELLPPMPNWP